MTSYRAEITEYKAKRIGQVDAKVVAPKGRKKNVAKAWVLYFRYSVNGWRDDKPYKDAYQHEADARKQFDKMVRQGFVRECWLERDGERVEYWANSKEIK